MIWNLEAIRADGWVETIDFYEELGSTNDHAIQTAGDVRPHPRLILCDRQLSGRGRGANRWSATEGALTFSLVIEPEELGVPMERWPTLSVAVGGAICQAIAPCVSMADVRLKWPNDVYADDKKLAGILVEVPPTRPARLVIGIGINVVNSAQAAPEEFRNRMTSLIDLRPDPPSRSDVLRRVLTQLRADLAYLANDPVMLSKRWRRQCLLTGRTVSINDGVRVISGTCQGIDDDGALRVWTEFGPQRCLGGTVEAFQ